MPAGGALHYASGLSDALARDATTLRRLLRRALRNVDRSQSRT